MKAGDLINQNSSPKATAREQQQQQQQQQQQHLLPSSFLDLISIVVINMTVLRTLLDAVGPRKS